MSNTTSQINGKTVLATGANRGLGRALVDEALRRGASRVYAGTREAADDRVGELDLLINNAGVGTYDDLSNQEAIERHLAVDLFGTWRTTQAFVPAIGGGRAPTGAVAAGRADDNARLRRNRCRRATRDRRESRREPPRALRTRMDGNTQQWRSGSATADAPSGSSLLFIEQTL